MNLQEIAKRLHGEVNGGWVNIRGHGHSKDDSSLGIRFDPNAPDGFRVHSLADDDPEVCRAHVKKLLTDIAKGGSISLDLDEFPESQQKEKLNAALRLWDEALPIENTPAALYLAARKCAPGQGDDWPSELRFHPRCRFGGVSAPVLIAAMRCAITCKFQGIHRTALKDDGSGKREMPNGVQSKMMLGIAEGIETALSARRISKMHFWAAMSAGGISKFPVVHGVEFLRIFSDHDEAGRSAARRCKCQYELAGVKVEIRYPQEPGTDWNDFLRGEYR